MFLASATLKNYLDADVAYLLGMIAARGEFQEQNGVYHLIIRFPYKSEAPSLPEGFSLPVSDFKTQYRLALDDAASRLENMVGERIQKEYSGNESVFSIRFHGRTMSWRNLRQLFDNEWTYESFKIHDVIFEAPKEWKREFVRGFVDVAAVPSTKDYYIDGRHRISIQIQHNNWMMPIQLCKLVQEGLEVPVQQILWGHPNIRAPGGGSNWKKEHRMRIFANYFTEIGFSFEWKQTILEELTRINKEEHGGSSESLCDPRDRTRSSEKDPHPDEDDADLPDKLRNTHFDSARSICRCLGCQQRHNPQMDMDLTSDPNGE